ncbi:FtsX-like permease family protein [Streptomyces sp. NPDC017993]|uniref:FtsX-like permease family protein n=1 Tax=Streptomyces sp. NPDC017993 TaxID=3365027 RepID=UPI0037886924
MTVLTFAFGQMRMRPAAFAGLAMALFLAVGAVTLFGELMAAALAAPVGRERAVVGPGPALIAGAFGEIAVLVAFFVVVNTLGFAVRQQHRELALLRTVAATPRQVRRLVRLQVLVMVLLVSPAGCAAGAVGAGRFLDALVTRGMAAPGTTIPRSPVPMLVAVAAALGVGLLSASFAARRISRIAPAAAMTASSVEHGRTGLLRAAGGLIALAGGCLLCRLVATQPPEKAGQAALPAALVLLVAVALLGPLLAGALVVVLGAPIRAVARRSGWLADGNLRGYTNRLSAAVTPVALLVGLSCTMVFMTSTVEQAAHRLEGTSLTTVTSASDVWLRQVELGMLVCFAAVSTVNTLAALTADRRREFALLSLVGATRRQLLRMLCTEALLTAAVSVVLGTAVAVAVAGAFNLTVTGSALPSVPWADYAWIAVGAAALIAPGILGAGLRAASGPATELVGGQRG